MPTEGIDAEDLQVWSLMEMLWLWFTGLSVLYQVVLLASMFVLYLSFVCFYFSAVQVAMNLRHKSGV